MKCFWCRHARMHMCVWSFLACFVDQRLLTMYQPLHAWFGYCRSDALRAIQLDYRVAARCDDQHLVRSGCMFGVSQRCADRRTSAFQRVGSR